MTASLPVAIIWPLVQYSAVYFGIYLTDTQIEELDLSLSKLGNKINTHNVIITGDFNLPNINWEITMSHLTLDIVQLLPTNYSLSYRNMD